jgi:hypothetical protein
MEVKRMSKENGAVILAPYIDRIYLSGDDSIRIQDLSLRLGIPVSEVIQKALKFYEDGVPKAKYDELKNRHKKLLETADILASAVRAYERKYGELEDEV